MPGHHIIVGGGLAGLTAAMKLAEQGEQVDLFSIVPVKRSHSVCAQGGINGAVNTKGEGDSPMIHFDDTIYGGDFLAHQPPVKAMCEAAPSIIYLFDRMGVMFNRTPEGLLDFRRFGGTKHHRTAFAGATTGQQLLYALDEQVRRYEAAGLVRKFEGWEMLSLVQDESGDCRGIVAIDTRSLEMRAFPADTTMIATGGPGLVFGRSTQSLVNTGSAVSACYQAGATYANGEFIQVHPTAMQGEDKFRLISESIRGEGGRVWTYRDSKPWYFLEEMYPAYGNLVPRDIATRAIHKVVFEMKLGVDGQPLVYLDVSHLDPEELNRKVAGVLEIYEKFAGQDPRKVPMKIFPAMHYSMGGLWVDYNQQTNVPGLFAAGECEFQYHGANRLGANSLLSCMHGGNIAEPAMIGYAKSKKSAVSSTIFDQELKRAARIVRQNFQDERSGECVCAVARARRHHDRERHRRAPQQQAQGDRRQAARVQGSMGQDRAQRQGQVGEPGSAVRAPAVEHAGARAASDARRAQSQRIARRALQAGVSGTRRREFHEDHDGGVVVRRSALQLGAG